MGCFTPDSDSGEYFQGIERLKRNSLAHSRGIKVRLTDGQIGRVQAIIKAP